MPTPNEVKEIEDQKKKIEIMRSLLIEWRNKEVLPDMFRDLVNRTDRAIGWNK